MRECGAGAGTVGVSWEIGHEIPRYVLFGSVPTAFCCPHPIDTPCQHGPRPAKWSRSNVLYADIWWAYSRRMTDPQHLLSDWHLARACLEWQIELGVDEAICDAPVDRYALDHAPTSKPHVASAPVAPVSAPSLRESDPVAEAEKLAAGAHDLEALCTAMADYPHCDLKQGARNLVFSDGLPAARVMIIGEAPGREEDIRGRPFVGEAGQLLDRMFAAISLRRDHPDPASALYITNVLPWRPPQNRDPSSAERAMMRPFVLRHIELAAPDVVVLMGRISASTLLGTDDGITKIRGKWREVSGRPALPMLHPAYLLRNSAAKREAWADLLELQAKLGTLT